jgi:hypothetical protein
MHGIGSDNQPDGLYHVSGTNVVTMSGIPTFGKLVNMLAEVATDNALAGRLGFITTPGMAGILAQTLVAPSAGSTMIWSGGLNDGLLAGCKAAATNQASSTLAAGAEHAILFGAWQELIIAFWGGLDLLVDPYTFSAQGRLRLTAFLSCDIAVRHAPAFCKADGATIV